MQRSEIKGRPLYPKEKPNQSLAIIYLGAKFRRLPHVRSLVRAAAVEMIQHEIQDGRRS
jgi:hypothetical protein